jgi:hypothetical protein
MRMSPFINAILKAPRQAPQLSAKIVRPAAQMPESEPATCGDAGDGGLARTDPISDDRNYEGAGRLTGSRDIGGMPKPISRRRNCAPFIRSSPVIQVLAESGAIIEYLLERHGIAHQVFATRPPVRQRISYADNFAYQRREAWTH